VARILGGLCFCGPARVLGDLHFCGPARVLGGFRFCHAPCVFSGLQSGWAANEGGKESDPVGDNEIEHDTLPFSELKFDADSCALPSASAESALLK
jgi:hypothetical protein